MNKTVNTFHSLCCFEQSIGCWTVFRSVSQFLTHTLSCNKQTNKVFAPNRLSFFYSFSCISWAAVLNSPTRSHFVGMLLLVTWNSLLFTAIAYISPHNLILTVCRWVFHCACNRSNSSCCSFFSRSNRSSSSSRSWFCLVICSNSSSSCSMVWF